MYFVTKVTLYFVQKTQTTTKQSENM